LAANGALQLDLVQRRVEAHAPHGVDAHRPIAVDRVAHPRAPQRPHHRAVDDVAELAQAQRVVAVVATGAGLQEAAGDDQVVAGVEQRQHARQVGGMLVAVGAEEDDAVGAGDLLGEEEGVAAPARRLDVHGDTVPRVDFQRAVGRARVDGEDAIEARQRHAGQQPLERLAFVVGQQRQGGGLGRQYAPTAATSSR